MAGEGERRMLFDIRGRRKNVVRVVYAVLALLMGGSLFLTVGPFSLSEIAGGGSGSGDASEVYDEQIERIEGRLAKAPNDANLLLALTRAQISAGQAKAGDELEDETPQLSREARDDYQGALDSWNSYLEAVGDKANPVAAQLVGQTFFTLAERGSYSLAEIEENGATALEAQRIAARERPNLNTLSNLALYEYFYGSLAAGDRMTKRALASAASKEEAKSIEKQLNQLRKQGQQYQDSLAKFKAQLKKSGSQGEPFQNPFNLGSGATLGE